MSLGAIFVGLLLSGLAAYFVAIPWGRRARQATSQSVAASLDARPQHAGLEAQREAAYAAMADLDFDRSLGKINDDDYQLLRGRLLAQAVTVLRQLDSEVADVDGQVEALVRARRAQGAKSTHTDGAHNSFAVHPVASRVTQRVGSAPAAGQSWALPARPVVEPSSQATGSAAAAARLSLWE